MKRIVVLIDGTWNDEGKGADTNVAKLDPENKSALRRLILAKSVTGTPQICHYHDGVGAEGDLLNRLLGGSIGLGLKKIVQDCYGFVVANYEVGDEIHIFGFSRGAYAARALTGLIGASGIQRKPDPQGFEIAWSHYRVKPAVRKAKTPADTTEQAVIQRYRLLLDRNAFHQDRSVKCVAVWDTVGCYGVPAGFGLAPLARYITLLFLGFHDTRFGDHVDVGLHAVAVDERRRPFVPTFWTIPKGQRPRGHVEQTWFAGVHCSVGGGSSELAARAECRHSGPTLMNVWRSGSPLDPTSIGAFPSSPPAFWIGINMIVARTTRAGPPGIFAARSATSGSLLLRSLSRNLSRAGLGRGRAQRFGRCYGSGHRGHTNRLSALRSGAWSLWCSGCRFRLFRGGSRVSIVATLAGDTKSPACRRQIGEACSTRSSALLDTFGFLFKGGGCQTQRLCNIFCFIPNARGAIPGNSSDLFHHHGLRTAVAETLANDSLLDDAFERQHLAWADARRRFAKVRYSCFIAPRYIKHR